MAAVEFDDYGPYDTGKGSAKTEAFWNDMAQAFARTGVLANHRNELQVTTAGTGLNASVATGGVWLASQFGVLKTSKTVFFDSNTSGQPRIDRVVARRNVVTNMFELDVVKGTPSSSPNPPALTNNASIAEVSLAQARINNGASTVTITDERGNITVCGYCYPGPLADFPIKRSTASITLTTSPQDVPGCDVSNIPPGRWLIRGIFDLSLEHVNDTGAVLIGVCWSDVGIVGAMDGSAPLGGPIGTRASVPQDWELEVPVGTTGNIKLQAHKTSGTGNSRCILKNTTLKVCWSPK